MMNQVARLQQIEKFRSSEIYLSTYKSFLKFQNNQDRLLYEITSNTIEDYETYLRRNGLTMNSISFYMRVLHTALNKAVKQSLIPSCDFFQNVYIGIAVTAKRTIGKDDLKRIKSLDLKIHPQLDFARDMFLLSLYFRGMSLIDMANLNTLNTARMNIAASHLLLQAPNMKHPIKKKSPPSRFTSGGRGVFLSLIKVVT